MRGLPAAALPAIVIAAVAVMFHWLPAITRPGLFFGVTVPADYAASSRGRSLLRNFRVALWACSALAIALAAVWHLFAWALTLESLSVVASAAAIHHAARRDAVAAATAIEVDLAMQPERLPGGAPVFLLPIAALAAAGTWAELHLRDLPPRLPVHWSLGAQPDRWLSANFASVLELVALAVLTCLLLAGSAWAVLHWSRRIAACGAAAVSERRFRARIVRLLLFIEYLVALPPLFSILGAPRLAMQVWGIALPATILISLVSLIRAGQGGSREVTRARAPAILPAGDRTDDDCWKLGMFYFNRADPSLLVEKRWGIGYTINFGNPWAWAVVAALVVIPVAFRFIRT